MKDETKAIHPDRVELVPGNYPLVSPIYQSVKFSTETLEQMEDSIKSKKPLYIYSRISNPTVRELENLLSSLQNQEDSICTASGVAALSLCFLSLLQKNDHVLLFMESYKPVRMIIQDFLAKFGVSSTLLSIQDHAEIENVLKTKPTRLMIFESPTNPMLKIADISFLTNLTAKHGCLSILDNTLAGFHNHSQFPIDLYIHSLTKFAGGHGDVMGGAILGRKDLINKIRQDSIQMGAVLDPHSAFLILRGMKTYFLRYNLQCQTALKIAEFLSTHLNVSKVYYPGLLTDPDHLLAERQMDDYGSIVSFDLKIEKCTVSKFINSLKVFQLAGSLGSVDSLACPAYFFSSDLNDRQMKIARFQPGSIRLAVGIENAEDLLTDLKQALH